MLSTMQLNHCDIVREYYTFKTIFAYEVSYIHTETVLYMELMEQMFESSDP